MIIDQRIIKRKNMSTLLIKNNEIIKNNFLLIKK